MKLLKFLNETTGPKLPSNPKDAADLIRKNCKPFLAAIKGEGILWRGTFATLNFIDVITPRTNRVPSSMPVNIHEALDIAFKTKFGWKPRSEGVFCSGSKAQAFSYGNLRSIWPIGEFKFVWSPKIPDLVNYLPDDIYYEIWPNMPVKELLRQPLFKKIIDLYIDKDINLAIRKDCEISLKCKQYYSIAGAWMSDAAFKELIA
jgi:hypothetical protein